jgi:hypothetical protein
VKRAKKNKSAAAKATFHETEYSMTPHAADEFPIMGFRFFAGNSMQLAVRISPRKLWVVEIYHFITSQPLLLLGDIAIVLYNAG